MNIHGFSDLTPSKGTFTKDTSKGQLWKRSRENSRSGCRPPVLTLDDQKYREPGVQSYKGCSDSPIFTGPDGTQWRLRTSYVFKLPTKSSEYPTPPTKVSIPHFPTLERPPAMSDLALDPFKPPQSSWTSQFSQKLVSVATDQGSFVTGLMDMQLSFKCVQSAGASQVWTLRDRLVDYVAQHMKWDREWAAGSQVRPHSEACLIPSLNTTGWADPGSIKSYHVQISANDAQHTLSDHDVTCALLKSKAPELDRPFVTKGSETKKILVSESPRLELSLVPCPEADFTKQYGKGQRLGEQ